MRLFTCTLKPSVLKRFLESLKNHLADLLLITIFALTVYSFSFFCTDFTTSGDFRHQTRYSSFSFFLSFFLQDLKVESPFIPRVLLIPTKCFTKFLKSKRISGHDCNQGPCPTKLSRGQTALHLGEF